VQRPPQPAGWLWAATPAGIGSLALTTAACLSLSAPAMAQLTGTIPLTGNVGKACTIVVSQTAAELVLTSSLDLTQSQNNVQIASSNENCNDNSGYVVTVKSVAAASLASSTPQMVGSTGNKDTVPYTLIYSGTAATFDNTGVATVTNRTKKANLTQTVALTYTGVTTLGADTYSDTLIFTILGK
jgi:hypothetical protein